MADPATQFAPGTLGASYQYTPVETRLNPPIHLDPVNYDAIQKAVQAIPGMVSQSALNPAVRNQMQAEAARYKLEQNVLGDVSKLSPSEQMRRTGIGAEGAAVVPGYQTGNIGTPPASNVDTGNTGNNNSAGGNGGGGNAAVDAYNQNQPTGQVTGQPTSSGQQFAAPQSPYAPANQNQPTNAPAAPTTNQPPPTIRAPANQPTGNQPPVVQNNQPSQQDLVAWQNQNQHPVMSSGDALNWAKNFDTGAQRATYLPKGGPNGEPAYAFHMKGGSVNTVPITQMVQNGAGPLVAGQNTSQVLNAASQGQQPPGQPPQQPGQQPQVAQTGQPPAAPGQFTPEQQQLLASQTNVPNQGGDISGLAADTSNQFLLQRNAQRNAATGDTELAPNTVRDNLSNVPRSTDPTQADPVPPGQQKGQADPNVQATFNQVKNSPAGVNGLPDAGDGRKLLMTTDKGISWYVDTNPDQSKLPKNVDSHLPYLVTQTSPWSETRMYNMEGTNWTPIEVTRPDRILDKSVMDNLHEDSTGWMNQQGQPDTARKINALRNDYAVKTGNVEPGMDNKLASMLQQVTQSQRVLDATKHLTPDDYSWFHGLQNQVANNAHQFAGMGFGDNILKSMAQMVAPGGVDPRLQYLTNAYGTLMKGREDPNLNPQEQGELNNVGLDASLPSQIKQLNYSRMQEYNRYVNQAVANRTRIGDDYLKTASQITAGNRISDGGLPDNAFTAGGPSPTPAPMVLRATPANNPQRPPAAPGAQQPTPQPQATPQATPQPQAQPQAQATPQATPIPVPPNNSNANPVDMSRYGRNDGLSMARKLPSGTWVKDAQGHVGQVP